MPDGPDLFDPRCKRFARDMPDYDSFLDGDPTPQKRVRYVVENEGTLNPLNGHFLCDSCYIAAGLPSAPGGWKCP